MTFSQLAGFFPAIVFPTATGLQLARMIRTRSAAGVSAASWALFGAANVALYVYAQRYDEWQSIVGLLLTAALDFAIALIALTGRRRSVAASPPPTSNSRCR